MLTRLSLLTTQVPPGDILAMSRSDLDVMHVLGDEKKLTDMPLKTEVVGLLAYEGQVDGDFPIACRAPWV